MDVLNAGDNLQNLKYLTKLEALDVCPPDPRIAKVLESLPEQLKSQPQQRAPVRMIPWPDLDESARKGALDSQDWFNPLDPAVIPLYARF